MAEAAESPRDSEPRASASGDRSLTVAAQTVATPDEQDVPAFVPHWLQRAGPLLVVAAAYLHCVGSSWRKWGDVLVDCPRELEMARQIAEGRALYSQVACDAGPLPPLLNGFFFRCFGVHADVMIGVGLIVAALMCFLMFKLARRFVGAWPATAIATAFLYLCAFAHLTPNATFNFVLPYRWTATYGIALTAASLLFLVRHVQGKRTRDLVLAWLFLALTALTKLELLFALALTHGVFLAASLLANRARAGLYLGGYAAVALLVAAVYGLVFGGTPGVGLATQNAAFVGTLTRRYLLIHMGLDNVPASLLGLLYSGLAMLGVGGVAGLLGRVCPASPAGRGVCHGAALAVGVGVYLLLSLELPFRVLPLVGACVWLWLAWQCVRLPAQRDERLAELLVWTCGLMCLARMGLKSVSYHYGFFMLPLGLLALGLFWWRHLSAWVGPRLRHPAAFAFAGAGVFAGLIGAHLNLSLNRYAAHTVEMRAPRGHLWLYNPPGRPPQGQYCAAAVAMLAQMPRATRAIVVPQGVGLTFFSGLANPLGLFGYVETEFGATLTDESLLEQLKAAPPELVIRAASDTSEHGDGVFGKTYAVKTWAWVKEHYQPSIAIGNGAIVIFVREGVDVAPMTALLRREQQ